MMDRQTVLSMEAGPRLDQLILEMVLGYERQIEPDEKPNGAILGYPLWWKAEDDWYTDEDVPPFSTDWNAAGQLMEAVNARFYYPEWRLQYGDGLSMKPNNPLRGVWWVRFSGKTSESLDEPGIYCPAYGLTGPHGIGLAALLAFLPEG